MSYHYVTYIGLAIVVVVTMFFKGYIPNPFVREPEDTDRPNSDELGILWLKAIREEADIEEFNAITKKTREEVKARFVRPFAEKEDEPAPAAKT